MEILAGGLDDSRVQDLLLHHLNSARAQTAAGSAHALDLSGLTAPDIKFWSLWESEQLIGVGALKLLSVSDGEIKSMHTSQVSRRRGAGEKMLRHIIAAAQQMGLSRLNLETGSWLYFEPARQLYKKLGFTDCGPFGSYTADPNSVFMTLELHPVNR